MGPGKLLGRLLIVAIVSLFDAVDDVDADDGIQWLGDACNDDDDCHDAFNLLCVRGQVRLQAGIRLGAVQLPSRYKQLPSSPSPLGGECTYHAQCQYSDSHSACDLTGRCACVDGFTPRRDTPNTRRKCAAEEADDDKRHRSSYESGVTTFGIIVLVLSFVLAVACLLKFVICNWNQQPPPPPRKHSRKYNYITVGYLKESATSIDQWTASLLRDVKRATKTPPEDAVGDTVDTKLLHMWEALAGLRKRYDSNKLNRSLHKCIAILTRQIEDYALQLSRQNWH
ncbi:hypothetical protein HPB51_025648 [Rhipicephalus microplus]|uniref:EB domain-containing protein n=1 Tax=Rhipicephalus microplus TaxID=6941 RepID=A0A9J6FAU8_RHIMP|nr:hypothetical protein HPB51_025648 [Rhipicephalus microplus]